MSPYTVTMGYGESDKIQGCREGDYFGLSWWTLSEITNVFYQTEVWGDLVKTGKNV